MSLLGKQLLSHLGLILNELLISLFVCHEFCSYIGFLLIESFQLRWRKRITCLLLLQLDAINLGLPQLHLTVHHLELLLLLLGRDLLLLWTLNLRCHQLCCLLLLRSLMCLLWELL